MDYLYHMKAFLSNSYCLLHYTVKYQHTQQQNINTQRSIHFLTWRVIVTVLHDVCFDTDFCKKIAQKEGDGGSSSDSDIIGKLSDDDAEGPFIHHPFKVREAPNIVLNIRVRERLLNMYIIMESNHFSTEKEMSDLRPDQKKLVNGFRAPYFRKCLKKRKKAHPVFK